MEFIQCESGHRLKAGVHLINTIAIKNPRTARAVEFIRNNIDKSVRVADVTRKVDVSRSTLDNRFREILGRTVHD